MDSGWIKIHRKLLDWEWANNPIIFHLFIHLLLSANHKDKKWRGVIIKRGQLITGLYSLQEQTGISIQSLRTALKRLQDTKEIIKKSTNKFSIITIVNWDKYQLIDNELTINQQSTNNQLTTNKNDKNVKNILSDKSDEVFSQSNILNKLLQDKNRHIHIIGLYWKYLNFPLENREQYQAQLRRHLKAAKDLIGYKDEEILETMKYLDTITNNGQKFKWTLETILKYIKQ